jgi:HTH-type transcriptional regulator / antitoxin HigA
LYDKFPVREMLRRGWVCASDNIDVLEQRFCEFFAIPDLSADPQLCHSAKKTHASTNVTPLQLAWLFRAKAFASKQAVPNYSRAKLQVALGELKRLLRAVEHVSRAPQLLAKAGVRLVFIESMPGSKLDGACFWLDDNQPVIAMTLRYDRIDNFWFVLRHEIEHVLREDGKAAKQAVIDSDVGQDTGGLPECEQLANAAATEFCVPSAQFQTFIDRMHPYFSEEALLDFAHQVNTHPGLVVGQLQRKLDRHNFLRKHQVKVRALLIASGSVDGWGSFSE